MAAVPEIGRATQVEPRIAPEADATRDLYERYGSQIFGFCLHQLGNREEAEDATQTTFLNAFRGLRRGVTPEAESAWLFKIAHNVCLTRRRSSWRRGRVESPGDMQALQDFVAAPQRMGTDELIQLQDALAEMPATQRKAILLREWQGLSYREIADQLELSQAAVETLIFRARRSLAQGLEQAPKAKRAWARVRHALDAGSLLAAAKALFTGGAAAKAVATAAAVTTAGVVATAPLQSQEQRKPEPAPKMPAATLVEKDVPKVAPAVRDRAAGRTGLAVERPLRETPARAQAGRPDDPVRVRKHGVRLPDTKSAVTAAATAEAAAAPAVAVEPTGGETPSAGGNDVPAAPGATETPRREERRAESPKGKDDEAPKPQDAPRQGRSDDSSKGKNDEAKGKNDESKGKDDESKRGRDVEQPKAKEPEAPKPQDSKPGRSESSGKSGRDEDSAKPGRDQDSPKSGKDQPAAAQAKQEESSTKGVKAVEPARTTHGSDSRGEGKAEVAKHEAPAPEAPAQEAPAPEAPAAAAAPQERGGDRDRDKGSENSGGGKGKGK